MEDAVVEERVQSKRSFLNCGKDWTSEPFHPEEAGYPCLKIGLLELFCIYIVNFRENTSMDTMNPSGLHYYAGCFVSLFMRETF